MADRFSDVPNWLAYGTAAPRALAEIEPPVYDEYLPNPERRYVTEYDIKAGQRDDTGIYAGRRPDITEQAINTRLPYEDLYILSDEARGTTALLEIGKDRVPADWDIRNYNARIDAARSAERGLDYVIPLSIDPRFGPESKTEPKPVTGSVSKISNTYYVPVDITPKWADEQESWEEVDFDPFPKLVPIQAYRDNRFSYAEGEVPPPSAEQQRMRGYAEGEVLPPTVEQQRMFGVLRQEHDAVAGQHPRDKPLFDALNRDMGRYIETPYGPIYQEPSQRISYKPNQAIPTNFLESW